MAVVLSSIGIVEHATSIQLAIFPVTFVLALVRPLKSAVSAHLIPLPGAPVLRAIGRDVDAVAPADALIELSLECKLVWHGKAAFSFRLVILPHAVIEVAIRIRPAALSVGPIIDPVAFIRGAIGPDLRAVALTCIGGALEPLSLIAGAVREDHFVFHFVPLLVFSRLLAVDTFDLRLLLSKVNEVSIFARRGKGPKFFTYLTIVLVFLGSRPFPGELEY